MISFFTRACLVLLLVSPALAQTDRGTITGTVADATRAVLPGVSVIATNTETGARHETVSTETGNYTLTQMPAGVYELSAELPGFRRYVRRGITVLVAQTLRIDVALEVGATAEEVNVIADAPLLRTESADLSTSVSQGRLNDLPILTVGAINSSYGIRNPMATAIMVPGAYYVPSGSLVINGLPSNSTKIRVDGHDASNSNITVFNAHTQQSTDAIQETTIQTSNFAAEYGQVGAGLFNQTTRSGTNRLRGSAYNYYVNEFMHAGIPYRPLTSEGRNPRERDRKNNYGGTLGGPLVIPRIYDGHNRSFFFFAFEEYRNKNIVNFQTFTVPTPEYRAGDFSALLTGRQLGVDPLQRPIMEGTIYDPATQRIVNGQSVRDPFPGNRIPLDRMDPVALKVQSYIPLPTDPGLANNWHPIYPSERVVTIASIKIDHNLNTRNKLAFYFSSNKSDTQYQPTPLDSDGLPDIITTALGGFNESATTRLNYDWTISPTVLFHMGAGYQHTYYPEDSPFLRQERGFDALAEFGLPGQTAKVIVPTFNDLQTANGGMKNMGPRIQRRTTVVKPTGVATLLWTKNNHTYKFGADWRLEGLPLSNFSNTSGTYGFNADQTGLGRIQNLGGGFVGFPYASFLLGHVNQGSIAQPTRSRTGREVFAAYAQDSWKVRPTLTLDYGLRWDYSGYFKEHHGRLPIFSPTVINSRTGTPGGVIFEGDGPGRCGCSWTDNYKWAFGPRLGAAWQAIDKTVVRGGIGVVYNTIADTTGRGFGDAIGITNVFSSPGVGLPAFLLKEGVPGALPWPLYDSGLSPLPGTLNFIGREIDPGTARPARMVQWSLTVQREITPNFAVEVAYVGNRGVWWEANGMRNINANTPERLRSFGLDIANPADFALLRQPVNSATAIARGFGPNSVHMPYPGFPANSTVAQMLRPFPQFQNITNNMSPLGKTWYDGLQIKATKRMSYGLDFSSTFAWQKELALGVDAATHNIFDYQSNKTITSLSRPLSLVFAGNYRVPGLNSLPRALSWALSNWEFGAVMQYASGQPIQAPTAQTQLATVLTPGTGGTINTFAIRAPGQPLYTVDLNCHCFDPRKTFVLNPNAWADPPQGQFSSGAAYYNDYRRQRRPQESISLGRVFTVREGMELSIRAEFANVFNRLPVLNPTSGNARATQQIDPRTGNTLSGFGSISGNLGTRDLPRTGMLVARIRF
ncbi:MAG: TonB-dependent receptor [Acidobacteria bacterium]|nr:TonB-dependent receptor [Acidobacteriota bacterium]